MTQAPTTQSGAASATGSAPFLIAVIAIVLWGATPAATEIAVAEIEPALVGMLRALLAAPILLILIPLLSVTRPRGPDAWALATVAGLGGYVGFTVLFSLGLAITSTAHAALIIATAPIVTGLIGFATTKAWPRWIWWIGAGVSFIGVAVLILGGGRGTPAGGTAPSIAGDLLCVAATACAAAGYVAGGRLSARIGSWSAMSWSVLIASAILLPFAAARMVAEFDVTAVTPLGGSMVLFLALGSSVIGYACWYWALDKGGVSRIAPVQFAQPLVSLLIAVLVLSETLSPTVLVATALILAGVTIARRA